MQKRRRARKVDSRMGRNRIVICADGIEVIRSELQERLPEWSVESAEGGALLDAAESASVLVPARGTVSREVIEKTRRCLLVQQFGAGVDGVDLLAAAEHGIPVCRVPTSASGSADAIAQLVAFHLVALSRGYARKLRQGGRALLESWIGDDLVGATVGILGYGDVGQAVARMLEPWDVRVIAIKRRPESARSSPSTLDWVGGPERMSELLGTSDYIVLSLPLNSVTHHLISDGEFATMKTGVRIVNVGRAEVIDREAARRALAFGKVDAIGLDVFWEEPPDPQDPILQAATLYTPHIGGLSRRVVATTADVVATNCLRAVRGERLQHVVGVDVSS